MKNNDNFVRRRSQKENNYRQEKNDGEAQVIMHLTLEVEKLRTQSADYKAEIELWKEKYYKREEYFRFEIDSMEKNSKVRWFRLIDT